MLFNYFYNLSQGILVEVDTSLQIKLSTQHIKEDVSAVALVEFAYLSREFVEHWKALACVALTLNHRRHLILKFGNLLL